MSQEINNPALLNKQDMLSALKAASDETRLRLLVLLSQTEHNVKDLTEILEQSQPRLSRHLKLLTTAGLIERFQEGAWVYYRSARGGCCHRLLESILKTTNLTDRLFQQDQKRAEKVKAKRASEAQHYFKTHAKDWDKIRSLYVAEDKVETEMQKLLGCAPVDLLLDLGTGTGRILELFANQFNKAIGIDINHEMLRHARARLDRLNLNNCELRQSDITKLSFADECADVIIMHQILHFFSKPQEVCRQAARLLKPGGHLLIVDFAPHSNEQLRQDFAHQRLGFTETQIWTWLKAAGLKAKKHKQLSNTQSTNTHTSPNQNALNLLSVSLWLAEK